ncbi:aminotransferase class V-fold PLP-dependent enzyme, partial [Escherichia coli]
MRKLACWQLLMSPTAGNENPLAEMITLAHQHGTKVLVDGAQAVMHHPV